ncbi:MAG: hypothetical protein A2010_04710 [Nitrospirae bacterium GWD2_57_9]|nr:MAG: hypothetical protein A2010_04710 [Nitrospirae bacterium GWD2_57_9]OGW47096.1 MAG: hypothetical protein A2078_05630 [Nitrospirae bacterium GWC2_57_9]
MNRSNALSEDHSVPGMLVFTGLFIPVFWVWAGHTVYSTRFDTDDIISRLLTFFQMFAVVGMAVEVHHASQGRTGGFSLLAANLASRFLSPLSAMGLLLSCFLGLLVEEEVSTGRLIGRKGIKLILLSDPDATDLLPTGHDAWVVGNEPAVVVDFQGVVEYAVKKAA